MWALWAAEALVLFLGLTVLTSAALLHRRAQMHARRVESLDEQVENAAADVLRDAYMEALSEGKTFVAPHRRGTAGDDLIEDDRFPF